jgi:hypothetical protein
MLNTRLRCSALFLALIAGVSSAQGPGASSAPQAQPTGKEGYVQVTSVTIEPTTIHKINKPDHSTVFVQVLADGKIPPDSNATVEIGTYSTAPPGIKVCYAKQSEIVPVKKGLIVVRFQVRTCPDTGPGKVVIAATVHYVTGILKIKDPASYGDWRAELVTAVP